MSKPEIHRAGWVVLHSGKIIPNGYIKVAGGRIVEAGAWNGRGKARDHGGGALLPALINPHTHLELSALCGKLPFGRGFTSWVAALIKAREAAGEEALISGVISAMADLKKRGCLAIGDISTLGISKEPLLSSGLYGVMFRESLGSEITGDLQGRGNDRLSLSLSGHAPHTTSPSLLIRLKKEAGKQAMPFSIHVDESEEENQFLSSGKGAWADFLRSRGIDFSSWNLPVKGPVQYLDDLGILDENTIAVHLIRAEKEEFEILRKRKTRVVLCPRSNMNLHEKLPDLPGMLHFGLAPSLATDSLASNDSLCMFHEMAFALEKFPSVAPEIIFDMATINGAKALGMDKRLGTLEPGKEAAFFYAPVVAKTKEQLIASIVNYNPGDNIR